MALVTPFNYQSCPDEVGKELQGRRLMFDHRPSSLAGATVAQESLSLFGEALREWNARKADLPRNGLPHHRDDLREIERNIFGRLNTRPVNALDMFSLLRRLRDGRELEKSLRLPLGDCRSCGLPMIYETLNGVQWSAVSSCEPVPTLPPRVEIDVPSGVLLFHHDPRAALSPTSGTHWENEEREALGNRASTSANGVIALLRRYALEGLLRLPVRGHASLVDAEGGWHIIDPGIFGKRDSTLNRRTLVTGRRLLFCGDAALFQEPPTDAAQIRCTPGRYRLTLNRAAYEQSPQFPLLYGHLGLVES